MPETLPVHFRLPPEENQMVEALQWLHKGNRSEAVREAIRRYYADEGERAEELRRLVEEADDG